LKNLKNKSILLGVSGGIASYKSYEIVSQLSKLNISTQCVLTKNALKFTSPLVFETLSYRSCYSDQFSYDLRAPLHIELARMHDLLLVTPATANFIAKVATGICDDLLSSLLCAFPKNKKIFIAPAMNTEMWENPIVQKNIKTIKTELNVKFIEPDLGKLACQTFGVGKLASVEKIVFYLREALFEEEPIQILDNKKILVTLGGFREYLDPVRFLGNKSSGKMGLSIAKQAYRLGAKEIKIISGNRNIKSLDQAFFNCLEKDRLQVFFAENFTELEDLLWKNFQSADILVMSAAVPDFRVQNYHKEKIKEERISLNLEKNPDLLFKLSKLKSPAQKIIGFSAETDLLKLKENAKSKLRKKNLDLIIANDVSNQEIGFDSDFNETYLFSSKQERFLSRKKKDELAKEIWQVFDLWFNKN